MEKYYSLEVKVPQYATHDDLKTILMNNVYNIGCLFFEQIGEHGDILRGNGHHMAQELAEKAEEIWNMHLNQTKK